MFDFVFSKGNNFLTYCLHCSPSEWGLFSKNTRFPEQIIFCKSRLPLRRKAKCKWQSCLPEMLIHLPEFLQESVITLTISCTTTHRYPIFSTRYTVMCKVYTGYYGASEIEHGLCACTVDNPLAKARGLSLLTGAQTMLYLPPVSLLHSFLMKHGRSAHFINENNCNII